MSPVSEEVHDAKTPLATINRLISSLFIFAALDYRSIYRPPLVLRAPAWFRLFSRSLRLRNSRETPGGSLPLPLTAVQPARCLGTRAVLSRQSRARNAISMGFFWGLVSKPPLCRREREREGPSPRLHRSSPYPTGSKCSSQARQAAADDGGGEDDAHVRVQRFWDCFSSSFFFMHAPHALRSKERERKEEEIRTLPDL